VKLLSPQGVATADGVTALIPRSLSILARPNVVEKVVVEPRRLRVTGVWGAVGCLELATVHIWLPRRLHKKHVVTCNMWRYFHYYDKNAPTLKKLCHKYCRFLSESITLHFTLMEDERFRVFCEWKAEENIWTWDVWCTRRLKKSAKLQASLFELFTRYGIIKVMKSRRMRLVGHVAYAQERWKIHKHFSQKTCLKARNHLGGLHIHGRIISKWN
jgi:hypothetical protein